MDPEEHSLVFKALTSGLSNCVTWASDALTQRIRQAPDMLGWTPPEIRREVLAYVRFGGQVKQVIETREGHRTHYRFYYKIILPIPDFQHGLFVEMRLIDEDPEFPCVEIVNVHPQVT